MLWLPLLTQMRCSRRSLPTAARFDSETLVTELFFRVFNRRLRIAYYLRRNDLWHRAVPHVLGHYIAHKQGIGEHDIRQIPPKAQDFIQSEGRYVDQKLTSAMRKVEEVFASQTHPFITWVVRLIEGYIFQHFEGYSYSVGCSKVPW